MQETMADLSFDVPPGFERETSTVTWRVPAGLGLADERIEHPVRPNLVAHRRRVAEGAALSDLVADVCEQLVRKVPGLSEIESLDFAFDDETIGVLLAYSFPAARVGALTVCQLQAVRLDGRSLTTLTITTEREHLDAPTRSAYLKALASSRVQR